MKRIFSIGLVLGLIICFIIGLYAIVCNNELLLVKVVIVSSLLAFLVSCRIVTKFMYLLVVYTNVILLIDKVTSYKPLSNDIMSTIQVLCMILIVILAIDILVRSIYEAIFR